MFPLYGYKNLDTNGKGWPNWILSLIYGISTLKLLNILQKSPILIYFETSSWNILILSENVQYLSLHAIVQNPSDIEIKAFRSTVPGTAHRTELWYSD